MSKIEWTGETWNPIAGCSLASPGCTNCYAMGQARRNALMGTKHYEGLTKVVNGKPVWTGKIVEAPEHILLKPLQHRKPTMWFVNSMSDLFHEDVPDDLILRVLDVIRQTSHDGGSNVGKIAHGHGEHTYQVLTKRSARMLAFMSRLRRADERIPDLLATPAAIRFISAEPLLGPIDLTGYYLSDKCDGKYPFPMLGHEHRTTRLHMLDWVIVGGESGHGARPMEIAWVRSIVEQCQASGVSVFVKQMGDKPEHNGQPVHGCTKPTMGKKGKDMSEWPVDLRIREMPTFKRQTGWFGDREVVTAHAGGD